MVREYKNYKQSGLSLIVLYDIIYLEMFNLSGKSKYFLIFLIIAFFLLIEKDAFAQATSINNQPSEVNLTISPENPGPNENVSLKLSSFSVKLNYSKIYWYIDDVLKQEGSGLNTFNTQTKNNGSITNVRVVIITPENNNLEKTLEINPAQVDLIVESDSYTPPFYKGGSYFPTQGTTKIVAIPNIIKNGIKIDSKDLIFRWKNNDIILGNSSGLDKNTLTITSGVPIKSSDIEVEIIDSTNKILANEFVSISPNYSRIIFYEKHPLYGILFNKALNNTYSLNNKDELRIIAEPYFFSANNGNSNNLTYNWSINGNKTDPNGNKNEIMLKQENPDLKGIARIGLKINHISKILQYSNGILNIEFGL